MNISMQLAVVVAAVCLCLADGASEGRLVRAKQQRPTRGFKNVEMMTARGFGKRGRPVIRSEQQYEYTAPARRKFNPKSSLMVAPDFGKRAVNDDNDEVFATNPNPWQTLDNFPAGDENAPTSIPVEIFIDEMMNNQEFTRSVVRQFIDLNQDGMLTGNELFRNQV